MQCLSPTSIHHYDVVIIGGGIAGVSVAELLARRTNLTIKVLEQSPQLGTGASGKLEGWFHAGALYSGSDDAQTFLNCLNGIEDLINHYADFFTGRCNIGLIEKGKGAYGPAVKSVPEAWLNANPVYYIHPSHDSPDIKLSRFKNDEVLLDIQQQRVLGRLEASFGSRHNWLRDGHCVAPTYQAIEDYPSHPCSLIDRSGRLTEFTARFDKSFGLVPSTPIVLKSLDVTMNPGLIMRDLVASAISRGVHFETGVTIDTLVCEKFGPVRIKNLVCRGEQGTRMYVKAKVFIFAVGSGFQGFLPDLNLRVRLRARKSAMVVSLPELCPINFVRLSIKDKFHFNHLVQRGMTQSGAITYSMLANSGYQNGQASTEGAATEETVDDVNAILESAERYFGRQLYDRKLFTYDCMKTEFVSEEEEKRRFSYWIEVPSAGNYLCILPGKFSFFPTVAYQSFLRVKEILDFKEVTQPVRMTDSKDFRDSAKLLVADHYPLQFIANGKGL